MASTTAWDNPKLVKLTTLLHVFAVIYVIIYYIYACKPGMHVSIIILYINISSYRLNLVTIM